jgi:transcription initiation factor TFIID subunit 1
VSFASVLENIVNELKELPDAKQFLVPVNSKKVPDYYNLIKKPIDLQTIRMKIHDKHYKDRQSFLDDMQLLVDNSALYNGAMHAITQSAERLHVFCSQKMSELEDKLARLEKAINPLLDDNSLISFNYLLNQIYEQHLITVENSLAFLKPVSKTKYKDYYDIIKNPIDLETINYKISNKRYKSRDEFIHDFELLYNNSLTYNGLNNSYTNTAKKLFDTCKQMCEEMKEQMKQMEEDIATMIMMDDKNEIYTDSESNLVGMHDTESMDSFKKFPKMSLKNKHLVVDSAKNSPKYSSDAEVFVDVESIDDHKAFDLAATNNRASYLAARNVMLEEHEEGEVIKNNNSMSFTFE